SCFVPLAPPPYGPCSSSFHHCHLLAAALACTHCSFSCCHCCCFCPRFRSSCGPRVSLSRGVCFAFASFLFFFSFFFNLSLFSSNCFRCFSLKLVESSYF